jgi:hypothetical protein
MVSIFLCPHFGQVISDCITIFPSAFVESLVQQESLGFLLSEVMASFFVGVEQLTSKSVPIIIEKCLIVCILFCLTELSRPIEPNVPGAGVRRVLLLVPKYNPKCFIKDTQQN